MIKFRRKLLRNKITELKRERNKNDEFIRLFQEDNESINTRINEYQNELNNTKHDTNKC